MLDLGVVYFSFFSEHNCWKRNQRLLFDSSKSRLCYHTHCCRRCSLWRRQYSADQIRQCSFRNVKNQIRDEDLIALNFTVFVCHNTSNISLWSSLDHFCTHCVPGLLNGHNGVDTKGNAGQLHLHQIFCYIFQDFYVFLFVPWSMTPVKQEKINV